MGDAEGEISLGYERGVVLCSSVRSGHGETVLPYNSSVLQHEGLNRRHRYSPCFVEDIVDRFSILLANTLQISRVWVLWWWI